MKKKLKDFEKRLENIKYKTAKKNNKKSQSLNLRNLGLYLRSGLELFASIVVGLVIGIVMDKYFETSPLFLIIFLMLGFASGIMNVYRSVKKLGFEVGFKKKNDKLR